MNLCNFGYKESIMSEGGIYIHIPFCNNKCLYCDFYSGGVRNAKWDNYVNAICNELIQRRKELNFKVVSLYIGGGTPSLMPVTELKRLIIKIKEITDINDFEEFTLEVNPEDVNCNNIKGWKESGVNRISLGIQSLHDSELKNIGRKHDSLKAIGALKLLIDNFHNVSADIMFGLPGQTLESYTDSLVKILGIKPHHVSSYSLMLEPGTAMTHLVNHGKITLPEEKLWLSMYDATTRILSGYGFNRYEISNYSLPGFESIHNSLYWKGNPYIGLGPGAHSYDGSSLRRSNPSDIKGYVNFFNGQSDENHFYTEEILNQDQLMIEMIMTRLRMAEGLNLNEFQKKFGIIEKEKLEHKALRYILNGKMEYKDDRLSFTDEGYFISDAILSDLI